MASNIKAAVGRWAAATSTGLQELTIAGLGWTPKAALFFSVGGIADGTPRDDLLMSIGVIGSDGAGGLNEFSLAGLQEDAQTTSDAGNFYRDDACIIPAYWSGSAETLAYATGEGDGSASNPGPIANGWRVDWVAAPDQAYFIVAVFFGGDDLQAYCGNFQIPGTVDGVTNVTAPSFQPNLGFFFSNFNQTTPPNATSNFRMLFGVAAGSATPDQGSLTLRSQTGAGTTNLTSILSSTGVGVEIGASSAFYRGEIAFDADGFDFTQRDHDGGGNPDYWSYLVFDTGDRAAWVGAVNAPTSSASDWSVTGPGFMPQAGGLILSNHTAVDSFESSGAPVECMAISAFDGGNAFCLSAIAENGVTTSSNASLCDDVTARVLDGSQTDVHLLTGKPSFDANGWTVPSAQITTADATARKWIAWAIESAAAGTVTTSTSLGSALQRQTALAGSLTAALSARQSVAAQSDAALRALMTLAGELDAALRRALAAQAGLDGALASEATKSAAADAALRRALALDADLGAALQAERSEGVSIDALLTGLDSGTVALDAALAALRSGGLTLDAALSLLRERDMGLDASLRRLQLAAGNLDAALTASQVVNGSLQAALGKAFALTAALEVVVRRADLVLNSDLDGALRTTKALSVSLQGVLQKAAQLSGSLSAALRVAAEPLTGSLQAALTRTATLVAVLSATVQLMRSLAVGLNAALQERAALSSLLDAVVGTPPAAYAPRGSRGFAAEGRTRAIVGPDNRIILVPANPRRH